MVKQMIKVRIRLQDPYYKEKLSEYLRRNCAGRIVLIEDSTQEAARNEYLITDEAGGNDGKTLVLSFGEDGEGSVSALQPADQIVSALMDLAKREDKRKDAGADSLDGTKDSGQDELSAEKELIAEHFVCVYSPQGGSGKTTFAMTLADIIAGQRPKERILYWMMEDFPEWNVYFDSNSRLTMSDAVYWSLMGERDEFRMNLDRIAAFQRNNVFFIRPCRSNRDLMELSDEELRRFMELLAESFDLIICDMGSAWEGVNSRILPLCGRVFLLYRDIAAGSCRLEAFLREEENGIPGRIILVQTGGGKSAVIQGAVILPRSPGVLIWEGGRMVPDRSSNYYERVRNLV